MVCYDLEKSLIIATLNKNRKLYEKIISPYYLANIPLYKHDHILSFTTIQVLLFLLRLCRSLGFENMCPFPGSVIALHRQDKEKNVTCALLEANYILALRNNETFNRTQLFGVHYIRSCEMCCF